jgi:hypothetical protein
MFQGLLFQGLLFQGFMFHGLLFQGFMFHGLGQGVGPPPGWGTHGLGFIGDGHGSSL